MDTHLLCVYYSCGLTFFLHLRDLGKKWNIDVSIKFTLFSVLWVINDFVCDPGSSISCHNLWNLWHCDGKQINLSRRHNNLKHLFTLQITKMYKTETDKPKRRKRWINHYSWTLKNFFLRDKTRRQTINKDMENIKEKHYQPVWFNLHF